MRYSRLSCVGSITSLHILASKKVHIVRRVGLYHVRKSLWRRHLPIFYFGINYQFAHLGYQKSQYSTSRWFQSRPRIYMAPASADIYKGGRMAEWLRPADCEVLTIKLRGFNYQFAHLVLKRSPYGTSRWFQSRLRFYMAPASADICRGQDGRVIKASGL